MAYNAALRGECRINQVSADHFHHQNSLQTKNATRHESHLNALLYQFFASHKQPTYKPKPTFGNLRTERTPHCDKSGLGCPVKSPRQIYPLDR